MRQVSRHSSIAELTSCAYTASDLHNKEPADGGGQFSATEVLTLPMSWSPTASFSFSITSFMGTPAERRQPACGFGGAFMLASGPCASSKLEQQV